MKKIFFKSAFVVATAAVVMVSCGTKHESAKSEEAKALPRITAQTVTLTDVSMEEKFTGTVEAEIVNNIAPQQPLRIKEIRADVGDRVHKGDTLVKLDVSMLEQAKAQLDNLEVEYERTKQLFEIGGASKSQFDNISSQYKVAKTSFENLTENTTLISPISGFVTARNYDEGDMYGGQPVLVIAQIKPVKININASEELYDKIEKGMPVEVTLDAYGNEVFSGKVSRIAPNVNPASHRFQVEVSIPNADERVRPGMFARVKLYHSKHKNVVIPDLAVQKLMGSGDRYVYIYDPKSATVRYSKVKLGRRMGDKFEVLSGVKDGDMVVVTGHMRLTNGCQVELVK